jgi:hypothetical protein
MPFLFESGNRRECVPFIFASQLKAYPDFDDSLSVCARIIKLV